MFGARDIRPAAKLKYLIGHDAECQARELPREERLR
jgi:hypothetical protein